ncbi:MAG: hypothetical protein RIS35_806 [Pseudomonadota bacterium]
MSRAQPSSSGRPTAIDIAIVGGGWAGIAAAVELAQSGRTVTLFEAGPRLGGRARATTLRVGDLDLDVDNGQHLMIGAYRETIALARRVGVRIIDAARAQHGEQRAWTGIVRHRLSLRSTDGLRLDAAPLPAPWHLIAGLARARGMSGRERLAMIRLMTRLRLAHWRVPDGETVGALLERMRQPASLIARLWGPLALGALNTPLEVACAQTFATVLRDALGARAEDSDFLIPTGNLSRALPDPAASWLQSRQADLRLRTTVRALSLGHGLWRLRTDAGDFDARHAILAVPPWSARRLLTDASLPEAARRCAAELATFEPESIATCYLSWSAGEVGALPPWIMLDDHSASGGMGQWLFDRGVQSGHRIATVVVSARGRHAGVTAAQLEASISSQVARELALPPPAAAKVVVDKRATFRCVPDRPRIRSECADPGRGIGDRGPRLLLAGDHAWPDYPGTLEAAVRSGLAAARCLTMPR